MAAMADQAQQAPPQSNGTAANDDTQVHALPIGTASALHSVTV